MGCWSWKKLTNVTRAKASVPMKTDFGPGTLREDSGEWEFRLVCGAGDGVLVGALGRNCLWNFI